MMLTTQTFHSQYACSELDELQTNFNKMCDLNDELTSRLDVADKLCDIWAKNKILKGLFLQWLLILLWTALQVDK